MIRLLSSLLLFISSLVIPKTNAVVIGSVVVNEFASNTADPDWVELYNSGEEIIDLSLYRLEDAASNKKNLSGNLGAKSWVAFDWSNKLNNDGDTIFLKKIATEETVDNVKYGADGVVIPPGPLQSAGRQIDGEGPWVIFNTPTKGSANFTAISTPTSTPEPTATPEEPTVTPTPPPASTPTIEPTSTPTPTIEPTSTPTPTETPASTPKPTTIATPTLIFTIPRMPIPQRLFLKHFFDFLLPHLPFIPRKPTPGV